MKAIHLHARGGPEQLFYEDAPKPQLKPGDALVHVCACAVTPTELNWTETYTTQDGASRLPSVPGHELCGIVEDVASDAGSLKIGDQVYGLCDFWRNGAAADYVAVRAANLAPKPGNLNFVQAAALPLASLTAWQALFDHGGLRPGDEILIHGATGGVGSLAVQLAHWRGAFVVATTSAQNVALAEKLGADNVIDYTSLRFEDYVHGADVVLDTVGGETLERSWNVVRPGGTVVSIVDRIAEDKPAQHGAHGEFFIVEPNRRELMEITRLVEAGKLRPIVEATFPLEEAREAFERGAGGHNRGKIVLQVASDTARDQDPFVPEKAA
jgi:NADPH:quinone reductase-like Zn-dependent oxidoreductase